MEEAQLIAKCIANERNAQRMLFDLWYTRLFHAALRYLNNREDAEDAVSAAFARVFRNIHSFRNEGNGSLGKWMFKIVVNESLRILSFKKPLVFQESFTGSELEATEDIAGNIDFEFLLSMVNQMPDGYRIVFNLYVIENFNHNEIAEMLGISVSTSKSQLFKARQSLISQLKKLQTYEMGRN